MQNDVGPELEGSQQCRREERIVNNDQGAGRPFSLTSSHIAESSRASYDCRGLSCPQSVHRLRRQCGGYSTNSPRTQT